MSLLSWIVLFCFLGGALSVGAAALFLLLPDRLRLDWLPHFVSFAIGTLLGAAFLALLPHALEAPGVGDLHHVTLTVLLGVLAFFVLEKMVLWRHCHSAHCEAHGAEPVQGNRPAGTLILVGDSIHNFVDGLLIAAAFLTDVHLGVVTSLAVAAHEIPQELGDFAILLHSGYGRARAFASNLVSSMSMIAGGVLGYYALQPVLDYLPYVLAVAAASFIYVAVADLIPDLHRRVQLGATVQQILLIGAGVSLIYLTHALAH